MSEDMNYQGGVSADPAQLFDLSGRNILITGSSRGLGRAMAFAMARTGAHVIISSRNGDKCKEAVADIEAFGGSASAIPAHVGKWNEIEALVKAIYERVGSLDVLVNNAGMSPAYPSPSEVTEALYDKVFDVNLKGPFRLTALVGARMVEHGDGSIINISSTGSIRPRKTIIPYAAAKAGVNAMTEAFADALGPTVRVNTIVPGRFRTDVSRGWSDEQLANPNSCLGRIGEEHEIVGAAIYLASSASTFTTGSRLVVDGGTH